MPLYFYKWDDEVIQLQYDKIIRANEYCIRLYFDDWEYYEYIIEPFYTEKSAKDELSRIFDKTSPNLIIQDD